MPILLWESIAEPSDRFPECHCSVILELKNGDLIAGYYAGEGEARPDAASVVAIRRKNSDRFDPLIIAADTDGKPEGNGILFQTNDNDILLIYGTMHGKLDGPHGPGVRWVTCDLRMKRSTDLGQTWSEVEMIENEWGHVPRCKPIRLHNGEIIFGTEHTSTKSQIWSSSDEGKSWEICGEIPGEWNQHPSLIQLDDGSLIALIRPSGEHSNVLKSVSEDLGRTWSDAIVTDLPCPHAGVDSLKLRDGRIVLIWNDNAKKRNPLTIAISEDNAETWTHKRDLITGDGSFHYPAIIHTSDDLLHVTFTNSKKTIEHVALTVDWITEKGDPLFWSDEKRERKIE